MLNRRCTFLLSSSCVEKHLFGFWWWFGFVAAEQLIAVHTTTTPPQCVTASPFFTHAEGSFLTCRGVSSAMLQRCEQLVCLRNVLKQYFFNTFQLISPLSSVLRTFIVFGFWLLWKILEMFVCFFFVFRSLFRVFCLSFTRSPQPAITSLGSNVTFSGSGAHFFWTYIISNIR